MQQDGVLLGRGLPVVLQLPQGAAMHSIVDPMTHCQRVSSSAPATCSDASTSRLRLGLLLPLLLLRFELTLFVP